MEAVADTKPVHEVQKHMKHSKKFKPPPLTPFVDAKGLPATTHREQRQLIRAHFANKLDGHSSTFAALLDHLRASQRTTTYDGEVDLSLLPSWPQIARQAKHIHTHKVGVGEDRLGGEFPANHPFIYATLYGPHFYAATATVNRPLQWRGGMLHELYKSKGSVSDLENWRDIWLTAMNAKIQDRITRPQLAAAVQHQATSTQYGSGLNNGDTTTAHLLLAAAQETVTVRNNTPVILALDIAAEFASMRRSFVIPPDLDTAHVAHQLHSLGFTSQETQELLLEMAQDMSSDGLSNHFQAVMQDAHGYTWYSTEYLEGVTVTHEGTTAGTTHADIIFTRVISKTVRKLHQAMQAQDYSVRLNTIVASELFAHLPNHYADAATNVHTVSYVDDTTLLAETKADKALDTTRAMCLLARSFFKAFAFDLNATKTEALITAKGSGAPSLRRTIAALPDATFTFQDRHSSTHRLRIVSQLKHVGTIRHVSRRPGIDIRRRTTTMTADYHQLRKRVLANPSISVHKRVILIEPALQHGLYNAATWSALNDAEASQLRNKVMTMYRSIAGANNVSAKLKGNHCTTNAEVLKVTRTVDPTLRVMQARLNYLCKICSIAASCSRSHRPCQRSKREQIMDCHRSTRRPSRPSRPAYTTI